LAFTGTYLHSSASRTGAYYGRMQRTHAMFEAVIQGSRSEAEQAMARVAAMHRHVNGHVDRDISPHHPAGTSYQADDPWLSFFTMAVLADSAMSLFEAYVGPLSPAEREDAWRDWRRFGEAFGMPPDAAPDTWIEFRRVLDGWLASDRPHLLPLARAAAVASINLPLPGVAHRFNDLQYLLVVGDLPERVRALHGLPWGARQAAAHAVLRDSLRRGRRLVPARVARGRTNAAVKLVADLVDRRSRTDILRRAATLAA
jgi:uncharacterized protein (DUF2236 family)